MECIVCGESLVYGMTLHTQCDHFYCAGCLTSLVENFTRDESLFPLRCCQQPIPITAVDDLISSPLRVSFLQKHAEFSVSTPDRIYCADPNCSTFLGSAEGIIDNSIVCSACRRLTCIRCKQAEHAGEDCATNAATIEVLELARKEGWQRCPGCHALVELHVGCYHMTCRCRAQFCYLCAVIWKGCTCPQWDEDRLLATAQQRVENEFGIQEIQELHPEVVAQQVQRRVETLRFEQECRYHVWRHRRGGGNCEECGIFFNLFLKV